MTDKYDVVIIGGGPGGYAAANRAAQLGKSIAVVEADRLGGICLNWGCIPTKALLKSADLYDHLKRAEEFGFEVDGVSVNWQAIIRRSRTAAKRLAKGIEHLFKKYGVSHLPGRGRLLDAHQVEVKRDQDKSYRLQAEHVIIATGARPRAIPGLEPDGEQVITYREALDLPAVPKAMVIIGAGAIGVEFAYFYSVFGTRVTLIEMLPRIVPQEDEEVSRELARQFKKRGMELLTSTKVEKLERLKTKVKIHIADNTGKVISADKVLVAVGVQGNVEEIGLSAAVVELAGGHIAVDGHLRTSAEGVYAVGDVVGPPWLAHVASAEGITAVEHLAGLEPEPMNYENIPACTYCQPEVASVGLTEEAAREAGYEVKVGKLPYRALGKAVAAGEVEGFIKLVYEAGYGELLGGHIIGQGATDLISEIAVARRLEATYEEVLKTVHPHPTLSEGIMEATAVAYGQAVNY